MQRVNLNEFCKWNLPVDDPNTNVLLEKTKYTRLQDLKRKQVSYFSTKAYVVGTQKNCLNKMVLLSTKSIC